MTAARFRWTGATLVVIALVSMTMVFSTGQGVAQDTGPGEGEALATDISVYAEGLNNPRGLDFAPDGALWVAEAGRGPGEVGPDTIVVPDEEAEGGGSLYVGFTGAFTRIQDGQVERVFDGQPSVAGENGFAAIGPSDVSISEDGFSRGVVGLFADPAERDEVAPDSMLGYLFVDQNDENVLSLDIAAFEGEFNPDNGAIESNPNGVLAAENGASYVVDASGNALLYVDAEGNISVTSVFIPRLVETPEDLPQPPFPPEVPMQSVPTSATYGPDGAIYVAELTGFPFPEGEARIWRVEPGEPATEYMTGFTNIIDLTFDDEGNLFVLEIDSTGLSTPPEGDGSLWMIPAGGGDRQLVAGSDDLSGPGGVTIGPDGALYVTNNSVLAEEGQVLRIEIGDDGGSDDGSDDGNGTGGDNGSGEDGGLATDIAVYAEGLNNPRGLDFGPDGTLWVAESGRGPGEVGPDTIVVPDAEDPASGGSLYVGFTGAFSKIVDGEVERVFDGLPSIAGEDGSGAIGPSDISVDADGIGRGVTGLFADPADRDALVPDARAGFLGVVDSNGEIIQEIDIAAFEGEFNPDNGAIESNPNGVLPADNGATYVVDASGNALLYVDAEGNISITSVFIPRLVPTPEFLTQPPFPPEVPMQAVPTSATYGPDGAIYVAQLTGFPFPEGEAMIWRVEPGEPATEYLTGFTNIIDIAFDGDGNLYVLEIDSNGIDTPPEFNGSLWRVPADGGDRELIAGADDLFAPGGITIGPDGALYVTNNSILADEGQVLRIEVASTPEGEPTGTPEAETPSPTSTPEGTETPAPTGTPEGTPEATATPTPEPTGTPEATPTEAPGGGGAVSLSLSADNIQFSTDTLTAPAGADVTLEFTNEQAVPHNFALYDSPAREEEFFSGDVITGPDNTATYEFTAPETPGEYFFVCEIHPAQMTGTFVAE